MSSALRNSTPKVRKNLADQIDRLDATLDGLADNLNEAVASAVKDAVQNVLLEVLTNPELTSLIRNPASPDHAEADKDSASKGGDRSKPGKQGFFGRLWNKTRKVARTIAGGIANSASKFVQTCNAGLQLAGRGLQSLWNGVKTVATWVARGVAVVVGAVILATVGRIQNTFSFARSLAMGTLV